MTPTSSPHDVPRPPDTPKEMIQDWLRAGPMPRPQTCPLPEEPPELGVLEPTNHEATCTGN